MTRVAALARLFRRRPGVWIDGRELARVAGHYAWRTRVSELRRLPFSMAIVNRQTRIRTASGDLAIRSEYKHIIPAPAAHRQTDRPRTQRAVA